MKNLSEMEKSYFFNKICRKSPLASKLKSSISRKLLDFFPNHDDNTDDVLAEYITVLVCNGKDQIQCQDDLDAFLGKRSAEFVAWLWDLLSEYAPHYNLTTGLSNARNVIHESGSDAEKEKRRRNRLKEPQAHGIGKFTNSLDKVEKLNDRSSNTCNHRRSNDMDFPASFDDLNTREASARHLKRKLSREIGHKGNTCEDFQTYKSPVMREPSMIQPGENQSMQCLDTSMKIVNMRGDGMSLPKREPHFRRMSSSLPDAVQEISRPRQHPAVNVLRRILSPKPVDDPIQQKPKRSVWDRLGKPGGATVGEAKHGDVYKVDMQDDKLLDDRTFLVPLPSDECRQSLTEARKFDKRVTLFEHTPTTVGSIQGTSNIRRKRHFGEISNDASSVSLVDEKSAEARSEESFQDPKIVGIPTEASEIIASNLVSGRSTMADKPEYIKDGTTMIIPVQSQVLDVKLRLRQIEMEMSNLRKKQAEMTKDGKIRSTSGVLTNGVENTDERTIIVTNVHFAATKDALMSYFATCGSISNVVLRNDSVTFQPKRVAYITFAGKDSVDKAVKLSGTSFFLRMVKVLRKAEAGTELSAHGEVASKPVQSPNDIASKKAVTESSHLHWRRESVPAPCGTSASTITVEKKSATENH